MLLFIPPMVPSQLEDVVPIRYVRPSHIVGQVLPRDGMRGLLPPGLAAQADDAHSFIRLRGSLSEIREGKKILAMYDVRPATGRFSITVEIPGAHERCDATVVLRSGQRWKMEDGLTGTSIGLEPRITDSGTAQVVVYVGARGQESAMTFGLRSGGVYHTDLTSAPPRDGADPVQGRAERPVLTIRYFDMTPPSVAAKKPAVERRVVL